jgi:hypothetical protein
MDWLKHSLEDVELPTCPDCGNGMQLYRSELVKFVPEINLHRFKCRTCPVFAESETGSDPGGVPPDRLATRFRFYDLHLGVIVASRPNTNLLSAYSADVPDGGGTTPVCTENLIRVDDAMESPKLAE